MKAWTSNPLQEVREVISLKHLPNCFRSDKQKGEGRWSKDREQDRELHLWRGKPCLVDWSWGFSLISRGTIANQSNRCHCVLSSKKEFTNTGTCQVKASFCSCHSQPCFSRRPVLPYISKNTWWWDDPKIPEGTWIFSTSARKELSMMKLRAHWGGALLPRRSSSLPITTSALWIASSWEQSTPCRSSASATAQRCCALQSSWAGYDSPHCLQRCWGR